MHKRKVLLAHNRYKFRGGEDIVVEQESALLSKHSHIVGKFIVDNRKELNSYWKKLQLLFNTYYSNSSYKKIQEKLATTSPDLVHVHNFFPLISPAVFYAAQDYQIPTVFTLHNYRLFHPNGLLLNNGKVDERGIASSAYWCIQDKVYRDSYLQTAVVAHMIEYHKKRDTWNKEVDRFIALSQFAKNKFIQGGISEDKISVKPNFVNDPVGTHNISLTHDKGDYFIFVGRISEEKDVKTVIQAWKNIDGSIKLKIVGVGPLKGTLQKQTKDANIEWLGEIPRKKVFEHIGKAKALIFPSRCYENFPLTILESFSVATPVIASNMGSQSEIVIDKRNGLKFETGNPDDLALKVEDIISSKKLAVKLAKNARQEYENKYTPQKNFEMLNGIYEEVL